MSINDISNLFTFIGGLGMFLYGMHAMSGGIQKSAGAKMQQLLGILTNNRLVAVLVGAGLTAIIQSSGATSVMVIGFVNAGIMNLGQAVGVIMGANIGTCITAWIVSLGQLGDSFKAISPNLYAPLLLGIGVFITVFSKSSKKKTISEILIGLGLLFIGLDFMGSAAKSYMDSPIITNAFMAVGNNPILGIAIGLIVTAIMQSSSASVGVLQTLAATSGAVTTGAAVFICLGADIGSCMPAVLSSMGATRNAKRVAGMHLLFNIIGASVLGLVGFLLFRLHPEIGSKAINSVGISMFHTGAKVVDVLMLFPFANGLVKLSGLLIKEDTTEKQEDPEEELRRLFDRRIMNSPELALDNAIKEVAHMGEITLTNLQNACSAVLNYDQKVIDSAKETELKINAMERLLTEYLVDIDQLSLENEKHEVIKNLLFSVNDIERAGDYIKNILEVIEKEDESEIIHFSEGAVAEMAEMMSAVKEGFACAIKARELGSVDDAARVGKYEQLVDDMEDELRDKHIGRLSRHECKPVNGVAFLDILSNLERISDHAYNVAGYVLSENE